MVVPAPLWVRIRALTAPLSVSAPEIVVVTPSAGVERTMPKLLTVLLTLFEKRLPLTLIKNSPLPPLTLTAPVPTDP